jgi:hypothetical protein
MKSRRRIRDLPRCSGEPIVGPVARERQTARASACGEGRHRDNSVPLDGSGGRLNGASGLSYRRSLRLHRCARDSLFGRTMGLRREDNGSHPRNEELRSVPKFCSPPSWSSPASSVSRNIPAGHRCKVDAGCGAPPASHVFVHPRCEIESGRRCRSHCVAVSPGNHDGPGHVDATAPRAHT